MKVTYIGHSGFLVETEKRYYLFDYYVGKLPLLNTQKPITVFCSHFHSDHFNPKVFDSLSGMQISAVLSHDIFRSLYPTDVPVLRAAPNKEYACDGFSFITLRSTDSGVAFAVSTDEGVIYHAGDLNDWYWEGEPEADNARMTRRYRAEIDKLRAVPIEVAFVPLDARQEQHFADGMLYFLQNVDCKTVYPMHYWEHPEVIERFITLYPEYQSIIQNTEKEKPL